MRDILEAVKYFLVRFFDSRFTAYEDRNREVEYLRTQLELRHHEIKLLTERINSQPVQLVNEVREEDKELPKPIVPDNIPWPQRKAMLERNDRERFKQYQKEREAQTKTTEELEKELQIN